MSPTSIEYTLASCYHQTRICLIMDAQAFLHVTILIPAPSLFNQTSKGRFRSCIEAHRHSKVYSPWKDNIPQPWKLDKGNHVYFDFST
jgi:hypothetical protein